MNIKIAICDDEPEQINNILSLLYEWTEKNGCTAEISTFPSAEAFLFMYEENKAYDILLLDIQRKGISGIELAKKLRGDNIRASIIFITSYFEYAGDGYDVEALNFLTKPVQKDKVCTALDRAKKRLECEPPYVIISSGGETLKIYESEIIYVESFLHYICVHTNSCEYKLKENISDFEKKLSRDFFRVHRSYIASLKKITKITRRTVTLGDIELPLSREKYDEINMAFIERN